MPAAKIQARSLEETKSKCKLLKRGGGADELLVYLVNVEGWGGWV